MNELKCIVDKQRLNIVRESAYDNRVILLLLLLISDYMITNLLII